MLSELPRSLRLNDRHCSQRDFLPACAFGVALLSVTFAGNAGQAQGVSKPSGTKSSSYVGALIPDKAPYEWRDGARLHFFKGKYWLLGGWTVAPRKSWDGDDTTNEIWSTSDLVVWTLATEHLMRFLEQKSVGRTDVLARISHGQWTALLDQLGQIDGPFDQFHGQEISVVHFVGVISTNDIVLCTAGGASS